MPGFNQSRGRTGIEISAEGDDQHLTLERPRVGLDAACLRVDCPDGGLHEAHARLGQITIGVAYLRGGSAPEHDIELGEPEDEPVGLVDQDDLEIFTELRREFGRQFEPAKPGTQHHDSHVSLLSNPAVGGGGYLRCHYVCLIRSRFTSPEPSR